MTRDSRPPAEAAADSPPGPEPEIDPGAAARAHALLDIDLGAVAANWRLIRARVAPALCAGVVKADAYGLGLERVAPVLAAAGCRVFFVAQLEEGLRLRRLLPEAAIGCLGGVLAGTEAEHVADRVVPVLNHPGEIGRWQATAGRLGRRLPALVHLDTGMNRLGLAPAEQEALAQAPERLEGLSVCAWLSHLACADEPDNPMSEAQAERLRAMLARLPPAPMVSLANSFGVFRSRELHFQLVRPGCALYGINPTPGRPNPMAPVVRLVARVLQVRAVDSPMSVGYGATHSVAGKGKIATIAVGYADGYLRSLSGRGRVFFQGRGAPVVGRVSMDLITADVTHLPESLTFPGTLAEIIGPNRPVDQVADEAGTIGYEVLTSLGGRYQRRYRQADPRDSGGEVRWGF